MTYRPQPVSAKGSLANVTRLETGGGGRAEVQRRTPKRGSRSCMVPARRYARRWGLLAAGRTGGANRPGMPRPPQRWIGSRPKGREPETESPPGVVPNKASNTARGTPEKWRTCGFTTRTGLHRKAPSRLIAARQSGPRVRRGPGVPRALLSRKGALSLKARAKTRRENAGGRPALSSESSTRAKISPGC